MVEHLAADEGAKVSLRAVMYRGEKEVVLEGNELEKVKVEAVVAEHLRGPKVRIFKYKPKKGYRRHAGHRQELTRLEVTDVKLLTRKPAAKAEDEAGSASRRRRSRGEPKAKPAAGEGRGEAEAGGQEARRQEARREEAGREEARGQEARRPKPRGVADRHLLRRST